MFKNEIIKVVSEVLGRESKEIESLIEVPPDPKLGDFALPCFTFAKELKKSPVEVAKELENKLKVRVKFFKEIKATGPYLNFFINEVKFTEHTLKEIETKKEKYAFNTSGKGKVVLIEYSSPNSNKPLHIGHLRNETLGMTLINLFERNSYKVVKANLINDRGIHICKVMLAYLKWAKGKDPDKKPDHFIGDLYVMYSKNETPEIEKEAHLLLKKWEDKDKPVRKLWKKLNSWAIKGIKETYKEFGSKFDYIFYESQFYDKSKKLIEEGIEKGIFFKDNTGAIFAVS
ncbi:arginine--tRNA ligase [Candidatus Woesearchaeota archaeon]|nr:arginine--tRNA ligase [Candidatus Woesearchaeota archaeon]